MKKYAYRCFLSASVLFILLMSFTVSAEETGGAKTFVISGSGSSTKVIELLAQEFCAVHEGYQVVVPPKSTKHKGGLESVAKVGRLFGRTGRPLSDAEKMNYPTLVELPIARLKTGFAVQKALGVSTLTLQEWQGIYQGKIKNWQELGGPDKAIIALGRETGETVFSAIIKTFPSFKEAQFVKIYHKEHEMVRALKKVPGAIGFSTQSVLQAESELTLLDIKDFNVGLTVGLVYSQKNRDAETVRLMQAFVGSESWREALKRHDFLPVEIEVE